MLKHTTYLLLLSLTLLFSLSSAAHAQATKFRYSYVVGDTYTINYDVVLRTGFSGNDTTNKAKASENLEIINSNKNDFEMSLTSNNASQKDLAQNLDLGQLSLISRGKEFRATCNRSANQIKITKTPSGNHELLFILPFPEEAISPGHKWSRTLPIKIPNIGKISYTQEFTYEKQVVKHGRKLAYFEARGKGHTGSRDFELTTVLKMVFDIEAGYFIKSRVDTKTNFSKHSVRSESAVHYDIEQKKERKSYVEEW